MNAEARASDDRDATSGSRGRTTATDRNATGGAHGSAATDGGATDASPGRRARAALRRGGKPVGKAGGGRASGQRIVLIEYDGQAFTGTVAELARNGFRVVECHREVPGLDGRLALDPKQWLFQRGHIDLPLHVLLPAEQARLSEDVFDKQSRKELTAAQARAARKGHGLCDEVFHGARRLGPGDAPGSSRWRLLAAPTDCPLGDFAGNPDLSLVSALQCEEALLSALPPELPDDALVVDGSPDRLRLLLVRHGELTESVELSCADHDALASDLPAALAAFAADSAGKPGAVVFSPSLGLGSESGASLAGGLEHLPIDRAYTDGLPGWESGEVSARFTTPGLASLGALRHLGRDAGLTTIPFGGRASGSRFSPRQLAIAGGVLALLLSLTLLMGDDAPTGKGKRHKARKGEPVAQAAERPGIDGHAASIGTSRAATAGTAATAADAATAAATATAGTSAAPARHSPPHAPSTGVRGARPRMPASLALAELCNRVGDGILLEHVSADRDAGLTIVGSVSSPTRLAGLQALAGYRAALLDLPYLDHMLESLEVTDLESGEETLSFRLDARWTEPSR